MRDRLSWAWKGLKETPSDVVTPRISLTCYEILEGRP
jgi:hypothetical protein